MSDFIEEENSRLIIKDQDDMIIKDARCITYPGTSGDSWWDLAQLLKQIDKVISIFKEAHPGCHALFIFDQSSAHASLGPEVLCAFDMNKSNGRKQQKQKDTIIPMSNPEPRFRGLPQKMRLESGEPKGLQQTLEKRGFNIAGMRAKCSPFAQLRTNAAAWLASSASKKIFRTRSLSLNKQSLIEGISACSFPNSIVNLIQLRWCTFSFSYTAYFNSESHSIGDGARQDTRKFLK